MVVQKLIYDTHILRSYYRYFLLLIVSPQVRYNIVKINHHEILSILESSYDFILKRRFGELEEEKIYKLFLP